MDYKKYELKKKRGIGRVNLDKNKALTGIQMKDKATTTTNNLLSRVLLIYMPSPNIRIRGIKGTTITTVSQIPRFEIERAFLGNMME